MSDKGIYRRYFRVTSGTLFERAKEITEAREAARPVIAAFCKEIGAEDVFVRDGKVSGIKFAATPDMTVWKQPNDSGAYMPRKNSAAGRAMLKRIAALPNIQGIEDALNVVGLYPRIPLLIDFRAGHFATVFGSTKLGVLFVDIPWRNASADDAIRCGESEHLQWRPNDDMVEVKRWQVDKELEELNERILQINAKHAEVAA